MCIIKNCDCILGMSKIEDDSFDIVLADPPYNIGKDFGNDSDKQDFGKYLEWSDKWIEHGVRLLKDSGTMYIYGFPEILCHIAVRIKLPFRWLTWHYTNKTVASNPFWQRSQESILVIWKDKDKRVFNLDDVREQYTDIFLKNAAGKTRKATEGRFSNGDKETVYEAHKNGAMPRDVIKVPALAGGAGEAERFYYCKTCDDVFSDKKHKHAESNRVQHPTQKPSKLTEILLKAAKPTDNGKLLIPFNGTGSESLIGVKLGLDVCAYELNEDYYNMAKALLKRGDFPKRDKKDVGT